MGASNNSLRALITQSGHLVSFHSETLNKAIRRYSTYENELYSIVEALNQWGNYILVKETTILTIRFVPQGNDHPCEGNDHKSLQFTSSHSKLQTIHKIKWINYLQQFLLVIKYQKVKSNVAADCLN